VGHGVSVHAETPKDAPDRAVRLTTQVIPRYEVPRTTPPNAADADQNPAFGKLAGLVLDMKALAETPPKQLRAKLQPLATAYKEWIEGQDTFLLQKKEAFKGYDNAPTEAIKRCRNNLARIEAGLKLLEEDGQAAEAFLFMNRAMWLQRTHSLYSEQVRRGGHPDFHNDIHLSAHRPADPFQQAFLLPHLPGLSDTGHDAR